MHERFISIATADGPMETFLAEPDGTARHPAVIVIMEAFGLNHHIENVCRHLAEQGFVSAAPDFYHRQGKLITAGYDQFADIQKVFRTLTNDGMTADIRATKGYLRDMRQVEPGSIGVLGFCVGGFGAFLAACRTRVAASVAFYAGGLVHAREGLQLKPLLGEADKIERPILLFFGAEDHAIPAADVAAVQETLTRLGKPHEIHVYPGAGHGFFCDERPSYRPDAAADAWRRTVAFLSAHLAPVRGRST